MTARNRSRGPRTRKARRGPRADPPEKARGQLDVARAEEGPLTLGVSGMGFVGVAMAVAFAHYGHDVVGWDVVDRRREDIAKGRAPFFDPGLQETLSSAVRTGRLKVASDRESFFRRADVIFLCLPTPSRPGGSVETSFLEEEALRLGKLLRKGRSWKLFVVKSTSPPGTARKVERILAGESGKHPAQDFAVACNPEFLAEGSLVKDALEPSRIVLGTTDARAERALRQAYQGFPGKVVVLPPPAAELVKYSSNALLAVKVSFANEVARLSEKVGTDVYPVLEAVGMDPRLGPHFLRAGPGFGGSCFPKDLRGLVAFARQMGVAMPVTEGALSVNETQARHVVDLAEEASGGLLAGREVALLGLAFKSGTDDVRESRAYPILGELLKRGAMVRLHDPRSLENFRKGLPQLLSADPGPRVRFCERAEEALTGANLALLQCDWPEYREIPLPLWKQLKDRLVVDARRSIEGKELRKVGLRYVAIGRGEP
ncbi:MAG: UDP-glucose/GDP-mannose dehydrogenase family protein [Euryarchaeota archaeon]|nr:UDP-glucose/GDP-mannose dehydrogenase family protein [Euryarchaeota archaeon]